MKFISILLAEIAGIRQQKSDLRKFGILFFVLGILCAAFVYYKRGFIFQRIFFFAGTGTVFLLLALLRPSLLKPFHKLWMMLAVVLGYFMTRIILIFAYLLLIMPMGALLRILGKDILDLKMNKAVHSFWKKSERLDKERYTKMY